MGKAKHVAQVAALATCCVLAISSTAEEKESVLRTVHNRKAIGREAPDHLARRVFELGYTDRVEVLETKDAWLRVQPLGNLPPGWLHDSELIYREITLKSLDKKARWRAERGSLSLLGRGIGPGVATHRKKSRTRDKLGYAWLDQHTDDPVFQPTFEEIARFLEEGDLEPLSGDKR